jgi:hypothetical protein
MISTGVTELELAPPGGVEFTSQMLKYLTQGNFGVVWLAKELTTDELAVMKLPKRRKDIPTFLQEVELHRSMNCSFIVAFIESFELQEAWPVHPLLPWNASTVHNHPPLLQECSANGEVAEETSMSGGAGVGSRGVSVRQRQHDAAGGAQCGQEVRGGAGGDARDAGHSDGTQLSTRNGRRASRHQAGQRECVAPPSLPWGGIRREPTGA